MTKEHVGSYYAATANPHAPYPSLTESVECDVCVIGGGYTGLSSALFLAEAGYRVVVLEAAKIGYGASGRNGGQLVNSYSRDVDVIEKRHGNEMAKILGGMMFEGADIIRERIERYNIACDYREGGVFAALNPKQMRALEQQKQNWEAYGNQALTLLDQFAIQKEIGSNRYVGGLLDRRGGHVHALNLALGEAEAIRSLGGQIFEQSAATSIQYGDPAWVLTAKGRVKARYVVIAGNAYLDEKLEPRLARHSMPCGSQIITTEPLDECVAQALLPNRFCIEDCNFLLDYFRLTADNRLLYGGGVVYGAREPNDIQRLIVPKMLKTFPQLQGVKIDFCWSGNFLLTLSRLPQFGRLDNNVYYMQGDSGHGVTCTHLAGKLIAEAIKGSAERFDAFAKLPHLPLFGGRQLQVPLTMLGAAYYTLRDELGV